jgi:glutamine cyclotransferase
LVPEIVSTRPHDPSAWTQGLILFGERMFESTGATGATSTLREVDQHSGEILRQVTLDDPLFAEGLERVDDRLIQLTWQDQLAFVYDLESFERLEAIGYVGEGWGLCRDADRLVMSNGSENLQFRDPNTFEEIGERVVVTLEGAPVAMLNELECVDGTVWANVWTTDTIVGIDPTTGVVTAVLDGSALPRPESASVLNGIAYDPATGNYLLTGKHWPDIYEVRLVPRG